MRSARPVPAAEMVDRPRLLDAPESLFTRPADWEYRPGQAAPNYSWRDGALRINAHTVDSVL